MGRSRPRVAAIVRRTAPGATAPLIEHALVTLGALAKTPDDRNLIRDAFTEYSRT